MSIPCCGESRHHGRTSRAARGRVKVALQVPFCAEEFTYVRARAKHPAKTTMISAQQAAAYYDHNKSSAAYNTVDAYLADLVDILRDEVA